MTRTLEAADYWRLRAICGDARLCEALARQARDAFATADKKQTAVLAELGFDPQVPTFTLDDVTLTVTIPEAPC